MKLVPHNYQRACVDHLVQNRRTGLLMNPGAGKTSIVLSAFHALRKTRPGMKALVVAPLRVCNYVWAQEGWKWEQLHGLKFVRVCGTQRQRIKALQNKTFDVFLINPQNLRWLVELRGIKIKFDAVVLDELTHYKHSNNQRSKAARVLCSQAEYAWGLTGSFGSEGYIDIYGMVYAVHGPNPLGSDRAAYIRKYFLQIGYKYIPYSEQAKQEIMSHVQQMFVHLDTRKLAGAPQMIVNKIWVGPSDETKKAIARLRRKGTLVLEGKAKDSGRIDAVSIGTVYQKMKQAMNGRIYDTNHVARQIHSHKDDALMELLDELRGQQLFLIYQYVSEREALSEILPQAAFLSAKTSANEEQDILQRWDDGELQVLGVHPQSAGHGLNLQKSGCSNICWYGPPSSYEAYEQTLQRVWRPGNKSPRVVNHVLLLDDPIDQQQARLLEGKSITKEEILRAIMTIETEGDNEMSNKSALDVLAALGNGGTSNVSVGTTCTDDTGSALEPRKGSFEDQFNVAVTQPPPQDAEPPVDDPHVPPPPPEAPYVTEQTVPQPPEDPHEPPPLPEVHVTEQTVSQPPELREGREDPLTARARQAAHLFDELFGNSPELLQDKLRFVRDCLFTVKGVFH